MTQQEQSTFQFEVNEEGIRVRASGDAANAIAEVVGALFVSLARSAFGMLSENRERVEETRE